MKPIGTLLLLSILSTSCVRNRAYRIKYKPDGTPIIEATRHEKLPKKEFDCCDNPNLEFPYRLAFIEFDDRGEMFDRGQLSQVVGEIRAAKKTAATIRKQADEPQAIIAVFVHGWKNNASEKSGNVWGFRRTLALLAQQYSKAPVVGIYVGWRGAVVSAPVIKEFTFWDRRNKSQNLPNAHMVEVLLTIMREAKGPLFTEPTISLFVGHSFGAALLETALTQTLEGLILQTRPGDVIRWPANLIVFVNEAAQATQSNQLIDSMLTNVELRKTCKESGERQMPVIISLSSVGDYATRGFFPFVQTVSRPFNSLRHYKKPNSLGLKSQLPMFLNTTAHLKPFQSHLLDDENAPAIADAEKAGCFDPIRTTLEGVTYKLIERPGAINRTPYWVTHMPVSLVPDHSTVFGSRFSKLLVTLLKAQTVAGDVVYRRN